MSKAAKLAVVWFSFWPVVAAWTQAPDLQNMDVVLRSVPDGPIAKVNGHNIPKEEFIDLYQAEVASAMKQMNTTQITDEVRIKTGIHSVQLLLEHEILYQEAVKRKLTIPDKELNTEWDATIQRLRTSIAKDGNKEPSEEEILRRGGRTREEAREQLRKALLTRKMREQVLTDHKITVSDADVKDFYEKNKEGFKQPERLHLQQIFVGSRKGPRDPVDSKKKEQAHERIEQALKRVRAGESFEAVAKSVSEAPDSSKGGDMNMIPVQNLPPFYVKAASAMHPGDISDIIESDYGYHFIKLIEIGAAGDASMDKASPFIRSVLLAGRGDEAVQEFCRPTLDKPGAVEVYLQLEKTLSTHAGFENSTRKKTETAEKPAADKPVAAAKHDEANKESKPAPKPAPSTAKKKSSKKPVKK